MQVIYSHGSKGIVVEPEHEAEILIHFFGLVYNRLTEAQFDKLPESTIKSAALANLEVWTRTESDTGAVLISPSPSTFEAI